MMHPPSLKLKPVLSAVEAELLRDLRSRLNRMPPSAAARQVLVGSVFKAAERVGLTAAAAGELGQLARRLQELAALRQDKPDAFAAAVREGALQEVLTRRLALAGREQPKETA